MGESMAKMGTGGILLLIGFLVGGMSERALADEHLEEHLEKHITEVLDAQIDPYIDSILNTFTEIVQSQQSNLIKSYIDMEKKVANNSQQVMNIEKKVANNSQQVMDLDNTKAEVEYVAGLLKTVIELSKSMEAQIQDQEEHIKNVETITASLASLNASVSDFNSSLDLWKLNSSSVLNNFTSGVKTKMSLLEQKLSRVLPDCRNGASRISVAPSVAGLSSKMLLCDEAANTVCEKDFASLCPIGFHLCSHVEFNALNDNWDYEWNPFGSSSDDKRPLGEIYCRGKSPSGNKAGQFTMQSALMSHDQRMYCNYGSSRPGCNEYEHTSACNQKEATALCCSENPSCGNGIVEPPLEECDDGNSNDDDTCLSTCTWRFPSIHHGSVC